MIKNILFITRVKQIGAKKTISAINEDFVFINTDFCIIFHNIEDNPS